MKRLSLCLFLAVSVGLSAQTLDVAQPALTGVSAAMRDYAKANSPSASKEFKAQFAVLEEEQEVEVPNHFYLNRGDALGTFGGENLSSKTTNLSVNALI